MATKNRAFRCEDETWEQAVAIAAARGETVTDLLVARLKRYVKAHQDDLPEQE
jgi:hypothetical protein